MELRLIAAASLVALVSQGCYRPMYAPPYSQQGYPIGGGYPGPIQTTVPGQPYVPSTTMPPGGFQPSTGGPPTYGAPPTYSPTIGPSASNPVPYPKDAAQFQPPETSGGRELGFAPVGSGLMQTAGTTAMATQPNQFEAANAAPLAQPTFAEPAPTPAPVTSDNFEGGNSPTVFN
jgi:hypothetical protein